MTDAFCRQALAEGLRACGLDTQVSLLTLPAPERQPADLRLGIEIEAVARAGVAQLAGDGSAAQPAPGCAPASPES